VCEKWRLVAFVKEVQQKKLLKETRVEHTKLGKVNAPSIVLLYRLSGYVCNLETLFKTKNQSSSCLKL
jgi:hypothetical protein